MHAINPDAGQRLKTAGMDQADQATDDTWAADCDQAIRTAASLGLPFQAADLVAAGLIREPAKHQQWGPRFAAARRAGLIRPHSTAKSKRASTRRSLLTTWIGAIE